MSTTIYQKLQQAGTAALIIAISACASKTDQPTVSKSGGDSSTAASGKDAAKRDQALIRFVNADPSTLQADLWFGEAKVVSGGGFRAAASYIEVPAEVRQFRVRKGGMDTAEPVATNNENLMGGRRYTFVLWRDENGKPHLEAIGDDLKATEPGKARVRVVNAAPAWKEVDIVPAGSESLISGVNVGSATTFKDVNPFHGTLQVRRAGKKGLALATTSINIESGKHYTIILTPRGKADSAPVVIVDQLS